MKSENPKTALRSEERSIALRKKRLRLEASYKHRREYYDVIFEHRYLFSMLLRAAELRHRYSLGDPQPLLIEAIDLGIRLAELWKDGNQLQDTYSPNGKLYTGDGELWENMPKRTDTIYFRFGTAAILALLTHEQVPPIFLEVVPKIKRWDSSQVVSPLNYPDVALLEVIIKKKKPAWWCGLLDFIRENYGSRELLPNTMECYADIVLACHEEDWTRAMNAVRHAEELYLLRGEDVFDEFEPWEGSGAGNALSIDLRLGALMKHCFKTNPGVLDALESMHRWIHTTV